MTSDTTIQNNFVPVENQIQLMATIDKGKIEQRQYPLARPSGRS